MRCNKYFTLILLQFVIYVCVWTSWAHIYEYLVLLCKIGCYKERRESRGSAWSVPQAPDDRQELGEPFFAKLFQSVVNPWLEAL